MKDITKPTMQKGPLLGNGRYEFIKYPCGAQDNKVMRHETKVGNHEENY
jgi:hypothetical protein